MLTPQEQVSAAIETLRTIQHKDYQQAGIMDYELAELARACLSRALTNGLEVEAHKCFFPSADKTE